MNTVLDLLTHRSASSEPALIAADTGASVTWAEIVDRCEQWRDSRFAGPVGLALSDPVAMGTHIVAAVAAGCLVAPMDPAAPAADTARRAQELALSDLVTDGFGPSGLEIVNLDHHTALPDQPVRPVVMMASSGSTGPAKIVPLTADQLLTTAGRVGAHLELGPGERGYSPLPLFHINGVVVGAFACLVSGSSLVVDRRFSRRAFWDRVKDYDVTWLNLVPAMLAILRSSHLAGGPIPGQVRLARSASAPLPRAVLDGFEERFGIPVIETYGMTEAASQITANPLGAVRPGSVGVPAEVELRVVDSESRPLPAGGVGRVQIRGSSVSKTYWTSDHAGHLLARAAGDSGGWLTTGDVGRTDADGYLYLVGRDGDVINRGGEKIRPREVEEVLSADRRVQAAVVVSRAHPTLGEQPVAYVQADDECPPSAWGALADELAERCRTALSPSKCPAVIDVLKSLPCGPTGKVRRADMTQIAALACPPRRRPTEGRNHPVDSLWLQLPDREPKPRRRGLTMAIDNGIPQNTFADAIASTACYIDLVKFGWGTALVTPDIERKFEILDGHGIGYYFGGTLFEKFATQDRFESFLTLCKLCGCRCVEVSNGTVAMSSSDKARYIRTCANEGLTVLSEVGFKDPSRSDELTPLDWVEAIGSDLDAGATLVITEARESGKSGICHRDGTPRHETVDAILDSGIDPHKLIFEAPTKELQTHFIARIGPNVNLGNIAPSDVIGVETLRMGLRSETLLHFERLGSHAGTR